MRKHLLITFVRRSVLLPGHPAFNLIFVCVACQSFSRRWAIRYVVRVFGPRKLGDASW